MRAPRRKLPRAAHIKKVKTQREIALEALRGGATQKAAAQKAGVTLAIIKWYGCSVHLRWLSILKICIF